MFSQPMSTQPSKSNLRNQSPSRSSHSSANVKGQSPSPKRRSGKSKSRSKSPRANREKGAVPLVQVTNKESTVFTQAWNLLHNVCGGVQQKPVTLVRPKLEDLSVKKLKSIKDLLSQEKFCVEDEKVKEVKLPVPAPGYTPSQPHIPAINNPVRPKTETLGEILRRTSDTSGFGMNCILDFDELNPALGAGATAGKHRTNLGDSGSSEFQQMLDGLQVPLSSEERFLDFNYSKSPARSRAQQQGHDDGSCSRSRPGPSPRSRPICKDYLEDVNAQLSRINHDRQSTGQSNNLGEQNNNDVNINFTLAVGQNGSEAPSSEPFHVKCSRGTGRSRPQKIILEARVKNGKVESSMQTELLDPDSSEKPEVIVLNRGEFCDSFSMDSNFPSEVPSEYHRKPKSKSKKLSKKAAEGGSLEAWSEYLHSNYPTVLAYTGESMRALFGLADKVMHSFVIPPDDIPLTEEDMNAEEDRIGISLMKMVGIPQNLRHKIHQEAVQDIESIRDISSGSLDVLNCVIDWVTQGSAGGREELLGKARILAAITAEVDPDSDVWTLFERDVSKLSDAVGEVAKEGFDQAVKVAKQVSQTTLEHAVKVARQVSQTTLEQAKKLSQHAFGQAVEVARHCSQTLIDHFMDRSASASALNSEDISRESGLESRSSLDERGVTRLPSICEEDSEHGLANPACSEPNLIESSETSESKTQERRAQSAGSRKKKPRNANTTESDDEFTDAEDEPEIKPKANQRIGLKTPVKPFRAGAPILNPVQFAESFGDIPISEQASQLSQLLENLPPYWRQEIEKKAKSNAQAKGQKQPLPLPSISEDNGNNSDDEYEDEESDRKNAHHKLKENLVQLEHIVQYLRDELSGTVDDCASESDGIHTPSKPSLDLEPESEHTYRFGNSVRSPQIVESEGSLSSVMEIDMDITNPKIRAGSSRIPRRAYSRTSHGGQTHQNQFINPDRASTISIYTPYKKTQGPMKALPPTPKSKYGIHAIAAANPGKVEVKVIERITHAPPSYRTIAASKIPSGIPVRGRPVTPNPVGVQSKLSYTQLLQQKKQYLLAAKSSSHHLPGKTPSGISGVSGARTNTGDGARRGGYGHRARSMGMGAAAANKSFIVIKENKPNSVQQPKQRNYDEPYVPSYRDQHGSASIHNRFKPRGEQ